MINPIIIVMGALLAILASFCFNYAIILEKKGLLQGLPEIKFDEGLKNVINAFVAFFKNKNWAFGFFLGVIGYIPYLISQSLVGIVVTQPLTSVGLLVLVYFAHKKLNEHIGSLEVISFILMGLGTIFIGLAQVSEIFIDIQVVSIQLIVFSFIIIGISILFYIFSTRFKEKPIEGVFIIIIAGLVFSIGSIFSNALIQAINSGIFFTIPILGLFEIIFGIFWFEPYHIWAFGGFWIMIIFNSVAFAFTQAGLQKGKAVLMFPIQNTVNMIVPLIAGLLIFQQTFQNYILFYIGVLLILIATIILSRFQATIETLKIPDK
ncbi:hypothetical protein ES706_05638 [subsurface metagenome]